MASKSNTPDDGGPDEAGQDESAQIDALGRQIDALSATYSDVQSTLEKLQSLVKQLRARARAKANGGSRDKIADVLVPAAQNADQKMLEMRAEMKRLLSEQPPADQEGLFRLVRAFAESKGMTLYLERPGETMWVYKNSPPEDKIIAQCMLGADTELQYVITRKNENAITIYIKNANGWILATEQ